MPVGFMVNVAEVVFAEVAVMVADVGDWTAEVVTVNVSVVRPAAMVMEAGVEAEAELSVSVTRTPFGPAACARVTVPVEDWPPVTAVGFSVSDWIWPVPGPAGLIVRFAVAVLVEVALMVATTGDATGPVSTVNVALDWPDGMVIDAGTVAEPLLLASVTCTPPEPARAASVTVPVEEPPAVTDVGFSVRSEIVPVVPPWGLTVSGAETALALVAVIVAVNVFGAALVDTVKMADVCPAGIVIDGGTVAEG